VFSRLSWQAAGKFKRRCFGYGGPARFGTCCGAAAGVPVGAGGKLVKGAVAATAERSGTAAKSSM
jgi:hypothetical protein